MTMASTTQVDTSAFAAEVTADDLTGRERDVLMRIAAGYSNLEIAEELFLSANSVKTYIRSAYRRIGVQRRSQAVLWAIRHGLLELPGVTITVDLDASAAAAPETPILSAHRHA